MTQKNPSFTPKFSLFEKELMQSLIKQASQYVGVTFPNPAVAAAVYQNESIISIGIHQKKGTEHAEILALNAAGPAANGASLMITLEPCTHTGETPPCVNAIIDTGIKEVIYAIDDCYHEVVMAPAKIFLEEQGIIVRSGCCKKDAKALNEAYFYFHMFRRPLLEMKAATSLDGRIALASGESWPISNESSQKKAHELRAQVQGIIIGRRTLEQDNPKLTVRYQKLKKGQVPPTCFVFAQSFDASKQYQLFQSQLKTILVTTDPTLNAVPPFSEVWRFPKKGPSIDWELFLDRCAEEGLHHVLLEGGASLYSSALEQKVINKCTFFIAPKILGQSTALSVINIDTIQTLKDQITLKNVKIEMIENDIMVKGTLNNDLLID